MSVFKKKNFLSLGLHSQFDPFYSTFSRINDAAMDYLTSKEPETEFDAVCISGLRTGQNNGSSIYQNDARYVQLNGETHLSIKIRRKGISGTILPHPQNDAQDTTQSEFLIGLHEEAISDKPIPGGFPPIEAGIELKCYYTDGRAFGLERKLLMFKTDSVAGSFINNFAVPYASLPESIANLFNNIQDLPQFNDTSVCPKDAAEKSKLQSLANKIGISLATLLAVRRVESGGKPSALRFEPHLFRKKRPDLAASIPYSPKNSKNPVDYTKANTGLSAFQRAYALDPINAIYSTSFGLYQVMGYNSEKTDNPLLNKAQETREGADAFIAEFYRDPTGVSDELLIAWFKTKPHAVAAAAKQDWRAFATIYNGSLCCGDNSHKYDIKLAQMYQSALKC